MNKQNIFQYLSKCQVLTYNKALKYLFNKSVEKYKKQITSNPITSLIIKKQKTKNEQFAFQHSKELLKINKKQRKLFNMKEKNQGFTIFISDNSLLLDINYYTPFYQESYFNSQKKYKLFRPRKYSKIGLQLNKMNNPNYFVPSSLKNTRLLNNSSSLRQILKRRYSVKKITAKRLHEKNCLKYVKKECKSTNNQKSSFNSSYNSEGKFWNKIIVKFILTKENIIKSLSKQYFPSNFILTWKRQKSQTSAIHHPQTLSTIKLLNEGFFTKAKNNKKYINTKNNLLNYCNRTAKICNFSVLHSINQYKKIFAKQITDFDKLNRSLHTTTKIVPKNCGDDEQHQLLAKNEERDCDQENTKTGNYITLNVDNELNAMNQRVIKSLIQIYKTDGNKELADEFEDDKMNQNFNDSASYSKTVLVKKNETANNEIIQKSGKTFSMESRIWRNYVDTFYEGCNIQDEITSSRLNHILIDNNFDSETEYKENVLTETPQDISPEYSTLLKNYDLIDNNLQMIKTRVNEVYQNLTKHMTEYNFISVAEPKPLLNGEKKITYPKCFKIKNCTVNNNFGNGKKEKSFHKKFENERSFDDENLSHEESPSLSKPIHCTKNELLNEKGDYKTLQKIVKNELNSKISDNFNKFCNTKEHLKRNFRTDSRTNSSLEENEVENVEALKDNNEFSFHHLDGDKTDRHKEVIEKCLLKLTKKEYKMKNKMDLLDKLFDKIYSLHEFCNKIKKMNNIISENNFDSNAIDQYKTKIDNSTGNTYLKHNKKDYSDSENNYTLRKENLESHNKTNSKTDAVVKFDSLPIEMNLIKSLSDPVLLLTDLIQKCKFVSNNYKLKTYLRKVSVKHSESNLLDDCNINGSTWNAKDKIENINLDNVRSMQFIYGNNEKSKKININTNDMIKNSGAINLVMDGLNMKSGINIPSKRQFQTHLNGIKMKGDVLVLHITIKIPISSLDSLMDQNKFLQTTPIKKKKLIKREET